MFNSRSNACSGFSYSRQFIPVIAAGVLVFTTTITAGQATEPPFVSGPPNGGGGGIIEGRQFQGQNQDQFQEQFQEQSQTQRQGDNRVSVDGDDVDYFALALPNLVAANCAGSSYAVGGGGGGFGFGFGQATIDENCQIAKAIATAHLLEGAKLIRLSKSEYRRALCQMRGMEHVCKAHHKDRSYAKWCKTRVKRDAKASKWSDRDLRKCGLRRAYFVEDRQRWLQLTHYDGTPVEQHHGRRGKHEKRYGHGCPTERCATKHDCCPEKPVKRKKVRVRVGQHCDFDRVVFDWPGYVKYTPERKGDKVTITFDRASQLDVSKVRRDLGRYIVDARAEKGEKTSTATLILASDVEEKIYRLDHRIVVDGRVPGCY